MTSVLNVDSIAAKDGTSPVALTKQSAAKSTLRFDGDSNEVDSSTNVSSVADNGTGDYTASVTNSLNDALYQYVVTVRNDNSNNSYHGGPRADDYLTATTYRWVVWRDGSGFSDSFYNSLAIHGDLA